MHNFALVPILKSVGCMNLTMWVEFNLRVVNTPQIRGVLDIKLSIGVVLGPFLPHERVWRQRLAKKWVCLVNPESQGVKVDYQWRSRHQWTFGKSRLLILVTDRLTALRE